MRCSIEIRKFPHFCRVIDPEPASGHKKAARALNRRPAAQASDGQFWAGEAAFSIGSPGKTQGKCWLKWDLMGFLGKFSGNFTANSQRDVEKTR